jgi:hypothetical protein
MTNKTEMQQSMDYTLKIADGILVSAKEPLDAILAAVGTLAQVIHVVTRDENREATLSAAMNMCRTYLNALDAARRGR